MPAPTPVLLGYADRFSVAPGESIRFMVSCEATTFDAQLVRLIHGDANPAGPGYREELLASRFNRTIPGRRQTIAAGSYVRVPFAAPPELAAGLTVQAWVWPTTPNKPGGQGLVACLSPDSRGFVFGLDANGRLRLELGLESGVVQVTHSGEPLPRWRWTFVAASYDSASGTVRLDQASAEPYGRTELAVHEQRVAPGGPVVLPPADLLIAARILGDHGQALGLYNGKIDRPKLFDRPLGAREREELRHVAAALPAGVVAAWDFAADIGSSVVRDSSPRGLSGRSVNRPTRAVTDHTWSGREPRWTAAPDQYAAIHFHDDDLEDAGWQPDFEFSVPETMRSGVYAARLQATAGEEYIPFYVRPPRGTATAPVAFLAPTLTYLAYANERLYWNEGYLEKRPLLTPLETEPPDLDQYLAEHRELGLSLYDVHSDGSGCGYSSRRRPILNMRPKYRAWRLHDAPRHFAADLYLVAWLEERGFAYDVITDEDLDREGSALLARYRAVLTGSHPEYYTAAMHAGVQDYLTGGGRLMYLGGNGFYWVTSVDPEQPHVIELRRGISGTRAWESSPGEWYHSTTGEFGGLWRLRGWAPQRLVGVGFAAQGWGGAAGYRRLPASRDPRVAFIFDGIAEDAVIGDFGFVLGGAAGDEVDRFDARLGSPAGAWLLATSAGAHTDYYQVTVEDVPIMVPGQGGAESPKVRADIVFFATPGGGAVFSVGSINWLGSLGWNGYANNVSRVTENVLRRFLDPGPFAP
ncbi:MAG TPA: N,N-dimethylformamidase beta subunit family domain-containing protein [Chloroflexota bacterium]|nr:N,N-dimethylformamidase beta subunit family domain-containing protein [Chloroflexota bacterium]